METIRIVAGILVTLLALASPAPANAQCDTTPPVLTGFNFSPTSVNTTSSAQIVTCHMTLNDALSGVASATCQLRFFINPAQSRHVYLCTVTTASAGVYSCDVTLPRYSDAGDGNWRAWVESTDNVGNTRTWTDTDLANQGFPTDLSVISDPDVVYPDITGLTLTPNTVDVSTGTKSVTCTMTLTDAKSGVDKALCYLSGPVVSGQVHYCDANTLKSGTRQNGVFECVLTIPHYAFPGIWNAEVDFQDLVGNGVDYDASALQAKGLPSTVTVTSSPVDGGGPAEKGFDFNPKTVGTGSGPTTITCSFAFADVPAGVDTSACEFSFDDVSVSPPVYQVHGCTAAAPDGGTRQDGTMSCSFVLPRYSASGAWFGYTTYTDAVGSGTDYDQATPLTVSCDSGPDPECELVWGNKTTLTWNAIVGATRYNVYRGDLLSLAVTYGFCENASDPNLTDLQYVETQVPAPGQGFAFLVSSTVGGVEVGLGRRSNGAPRTVNSPCP